MIAYRNIAGVTYLRMIEGTDTIQDIAAVSHFTVGELCDIIEEIVREGNKDEQGETD